MFTNTLALDSVPCQWDDFLQEEVGKGRGWSEERVEPDQGSRDKSVPLFSNGEVMLHSNPSLTFEGSTMMLSQA